MIELIHVSKIYQKNLLVFDQVSCTIPMTGLVRIIGDNSSGKTALLKMLVGLESPSSGRILVNGIDLSQLNRKEQQMFRQKIGFVSQVPNLLPQYTVFENVAISLEIMGFQKDWIKKKVKSILQHFQLLHKSHMMAKRLTHKEQKKIEFARAMIKNPQLLLMDSTLPTPYFPGLEKIKGLITSSSEPILSQPHKTLVKISDFNITIHKEHPHES